MEGPRQHAVRVLRTPHPPWAVTGRPLSEPPPGFHLVPTSCGAAWIPRVSVLHLALGQPVAESPWASRAGPSLSPTALAAARPRPQPRSPGCLSLTPSLALSAVAPPLLLMLVSHSEPHSEPSLPGALQATALDPNPGVLTRSPAVSGRRPWVAPRVLAWRSSAPARPVPCPCTHGAHSRPGVAASASPPGAVMLSPRFLQPSAHVSPSPTTLERPPADRRVLQGAGFCLPALPPHDGHRRAHRLRSAGNAGAAAGTSWAQRLLPPCRLRWLRNRTVHQMKVQHFQQQLLRSVAHMPAPPRARPSCPRPTCRLTCPLCPSSDAAWAPLDLPSLVAAHLPGGRERVFWKLVLVLPANGEEQPAGSPGRSGGFPSAGGAFRAEHAARGGAATPPATRGGQGVPAVCSSHVCWEPQHVGLRFGA